MGVGVGLCSRVFIVALFHPVCTCSIDKGTPRFDGGCGFKIPLVRTAAAVDKRLCVLFFAYR